MQGILPFTPPKVIQKHEPERSNPWEMVLPSLTQAIVMGLVTNKLKDMQQKKDTEREMLAKGYSREGDKWVPPAIQEQPLPQSGRYAIGNPTFGYQFVKDPLIEKQEQESDFNRDIRKARENAAIEFQNRADLLDKEYGLRTTFEKDKTASEIEVQKAKRAEDIAAAKASGLITPEGEPVRKPIKVGDREYDAITELGSDGRYYQRYFPVKAEESEKKTLSADDAVKSLAKQFEFETGLTSTQKAVLNSQLSGMIAKGRNPAEALSQTFTLAADLLKASEAEDLSQKQEEAKGGFFSNLFGPKKGAATAPPASGTPLRNNATAPQQAEPRRFIEKKTNRPVIEYYINGKRVLKYADD